jgi:integrase/recombinase XerD
MLGNEAIRLIPTRSGIMTQAITALRQRMIDDMRMRKLAPKTQSAYLLYVRRLTAFLGRPPDTATSEDLRLFQLHLVEQGVTSGALNVTITALKFFFEVTVHYPELMAKMHPVPVPRKLPQVLSRDEVTRLIASAGSPKYRAVLSVAYGAGLRASEVVALKVTDVDSERMALRIEQGKGHKDRYAMLSPALLDCLRTWWRSARAEGKILHGGWLFPGQNPADPLSARQLNRAIHAAANLARIDKHVSMHMLRHYSVSGNIPS